MKTAAVRHTRPLAFLALAVALGCSVDKFSLPAEGEGIGGVADTTYLLLNATIDLGSTEADPADMFINDDGHLYVAESGTGRISVWNQALLDLNDPSPGEQLGEPGLADFELPGVQAVCVGSEQLLFASAGDSSIWAVHLLPARTEVLAALTRFLVIDGGMADTLSVVEMSDRLSSSSQQEIANWQITALDSIPLGSAELDSMIAPHRFWSGAGSNNVDALAPGRPGEREVLFVNNGQSDSRVQQLNFEPVALLLHGTGFTAYSYLYAAVGTPERVVYPGTGLGFIRNGRSLARDCNNRLYYTMSNLDGDSLVDSLSFRVQRSTYELDANGRDTWNADLNLSPFDDFISHPYLDPVDISYTNTHILVCDRLARHVQVFSLSGDFIRPCGASRVWRDSLVTVNGVTSNLLVKDWDYDLLNEPTCVASFGNSSCRSADLDQEVIFVADQGDGLSNDRILLFSLSQSSSDLPDQ